jgi:hypothetical protein
VTGGGCTPCVGVTLPTSCKSIVCYHDTHLTPHRHRFHGHAMYRPYMYFEGVSPILYYDTIFFGLERMKYKKFGLRLYLYMLQCVNV